jgi:hypothetical protein
VHLVEDIWVALRITYKQCYCPHEAFVEQIYHVEYDNKIDPSQDYFVLFLNFSVIFRIYRIISLQPLSTFYFLEKSDLLAEKEKHDKICHKRKNFEQLKCNVELFFLCLCFI